MEPTRKIERISQNDFENNGCKMKKALKDGFFYFEMPEDCQKLIPAGINFAERFFKDEQIKNLNFDDLSRYHSRDTSTVQVESFYLERKYWQAAAPHFPTELCQLGARMDEIAMAILKKALTISDIPCANWEAGTGGLTEGKGLHHFSFNHYRPAKEGNGINPHVDFGHITILFINKVGLQAEVEEKWVEVPPLDGHFIVNFGKTLEMFVNDKELLRGAKHYVPKLPKDRISFGMFLDSSPDAPLYKLEKNGTVQQIYSNAKAYFDASFKENY